jgi:hypothetical protein
MAAEEAAALEKRLEEEKQVKQQQLDHHMLDASSLHRRLEVLQRLEQNFAKSRSELEKEAENQQMQARRREQEQASEQKRTREQLQMNLSDRRRPMLEAKAHYDLVAERCRFFEEAADAQQLELQVQISHCRYNQRLIDARAAEVQARIAALQRAIRERRPGAPPPRSKAEEKEALERSIAQLHKDIQRLKAMGPK